MHGKVAIVIGATGLVGSALVDLLITDERFSLIKMLVRRTTGKKHPKINEYVVDFNDPEQWKELVTGDVLFSAMGTTLKQAGSKDAQYKVDFTYQYETAKAAADNKVPVYVVVSSAMAGEHSRFFYTRMKGELENAIKKLPFQYIHIIQPGILKGERNNKRTGEEIGVRLIEFLNQLGIAKTQKPVPAATVARAMINVSLKQSEKISVYSLLQVFKEAEKN